MTQNDDSHVSSINSIYQFDWRPYRESILDILNDLDQVTKITDKKYKKIVYREIPGLDGCLSKQQLIKAYRAMLEEGESRVPSSKDLIEKIRMKPMRTQSGVTPVTVLTKPFPCPGKCIFCPNDIRMPKSYLPDEPGAQRALRNNFDPYLQTMDRLKAFRNIGHNTSKIELIVLGGTWSFYPEAYQRWFIKRCFEAMNDFSAGLDKSDEADYYGLDKEKVEQLDLIQKVIRNTNEEGDTTYNQLISDINRENNRKYRSQEQAEWQALYDEHDKNSVGECRCVGLVIETRPDAITEEEVTRIRRLGATKVQIGIQSMNDEVLNKNHRGHGVDKTADAVAMLRQAGFKIHAHWMANLYGSSPEIDKEDYQKLFSDKRIRPDELKIYPCSLLESAELMDYYADGRWKPYTEPELLEVLLSSYEHTPQYCRLTRVIRDIPSTDIVVGNKRTNFREVVEKAADEKGLVRQDIRSREIKTEKVESMDYLTLDIITYDSADAVELFLQYVTSENKIAGFLRLSLPTDASSHFISELVDCAMIREVHVYGNAVNVGESKEGRAQHLGLGTKLIDKSKEITKEKGFEKLAVISSIGTREYYTKRGFELKELYQIAEL